MQVKNWMLALAVVAALASCGEAGSSSDNPDATNSSTTTKMSKSTRTVEVVPEAARTSFEAKYPQASNVTWIYHEPTVVAPVEWEWITWPVDSTDMVANFKVNEEDYWVWFDDGGSWIGTVAEVSDPNSLPAAVNNTIKSQYPDYKIVSIDKENDKNRTAYEVKLEKGEDKMKLLIAENGEVMKKKGKVDGEKIKEKN